MTPLEAVEVFKAMAPYAGAAGITGVLVAVVHALRDVRLKRFDYDLECRRLDARRDTNPKS